MKIDDQGIEEIKNTIEKPIIALAENLGKQSKMDGSLAEIIKFVLANIQKIGHNGSNWEIIK